MSLNPVPEHTGEADGACTDSIFRHGFHPAGIIDDNPRGPSQREAALDKGIMADIPQELVIC